MRTPKAKQPLPSKHLWAPAETVVDLLFPNLRYPHFDNHAGEPSLPAIGVEASQGDASDVLLATLGQSWLIASQAQIDRAKAKLTGRSREIIEKAEARRLSASQFIVKANVQLFKTYYRPTDKEDEYTDTTVFDRESFQVVEQRTSIYNSATPMTILRNLEQRRFADIAPAEVITARRILRIMYDEATTLLAQQHPNTPHADSPTSSQEDVPA